MQGGWLHVKLTLVLVLAGFHGLLARWRKGFAAGSNRRSGRFYRMVNEIPTLLLIAIVLLAVLQPF
jgi:putative membrane protein